MSCRQVKFMPSLVSWHGLSHPTPLEVLTFHPYKLYNLDFYLVVSKCDVRNLRISSDEFELWHGIQQLLLLSINCAHSHYKHTINFCATAIVESITGHCCYLLMLSPHNLSHECVSKLLPSQFALLYVENWIIYIYDWYFKLRIWKSYCQGHSI